MIPDAGTILASHPSVYDPLSKVLFCCNPACGAKQLRFERPIDHAAHQLAMLADAGVAVVAMDPMHPESLTEFPYLPQWIGPYATYTALEDGRVERNGNGEREYMLPADARAEAAGLLAAARAAETETGW